MRLREAGVKWQEEKITASAKPLQGQTWVLTGTLLELTRDEARERSWKRLGREWLAVFQRKQLVLWGQRRAPNWRRQNSLGVEVLNEASFPETC